MNARHLRPTAALFLLFIAASCASTPEDLAEPSREQRASALRRASAYLAERAPWLCPGLQNGLVYERPEHLEVELFSRLRGSPTVVIRVPKDAHAPTSGYVCFDLDDPANVEVLRTIQEPPLP